jgi:hypothetical protein
MVRLRKRHRAERGSNGTINCGRCDYRRCARRPPQGILILIANAAVMCA